MMLTLFNRVLVVAGLLFLGSATAFAADIFWDSAVDGDWDDASKWTGGVVPGASDNVFITVAGTYTVTLDDTDRSVNSVTVGAASGAQTLFVWNHTLSLAAASEIKTNGVLQMRSATLDGGGSIELNGLTRLFNNCDFELATVNSADARVDIEGSNVGDAELRVDTFFDNLGSIRLVNSDATFSRTARIRVRTGQVLQNGTGATIKALTGTNGGTRQIVQEGSCELRNFGSLDVAAGLTLTGGSGSEFDNRGTVNVTGANLTVSQNSNSDFVHSGAINIPAGRTLEFSSGRLVHEGGTYSNDGQLNLNFVTINGTADFDPEINTLLRSCTVNIPVVNTLLIDLKNTCTFNAAVENATGATFRILGSSVGDAELRLESRMDNFGVLRMFNEHLTFNRTLNLRLNSSGAKFVNATGAEIQVLQGQQPGARNIILNNDTRFENYAVMNADLNYTIDNNSGGLFCNAGTINVTTADLNCSNSSNSDFINKGSVNVAGGRLMVFSSGRYEQEGGSISGAGLVQFEFATLNGTGTITNTIPMQLRSVTVNADFMNQSIVHLRNTSTFNGRFDNGVTGRCIIEGSNVGDAEVRVEDRGRNEGLLVIVNSDAVFGRTVRLRVQTNDRFVNATGATISLRNGTVAGTRQITVESGGLMLNYGTILNNTSYSFDINNAVIDNRAEISLTSATVSFQLTLTSFLKNAGEINVATGLTVSISNGQIESNGGRISGGGLLSLVSSTLSGDDFLTEINTDMRASTVNVDFDNRLRLNMQGANTFNQGLINGTSATMRIVGSNAGGDGTLNVNGTLKNFGLVRLSNEHLTLARTAQIVFGTGAELLNCTGGTVDAVDGTFGGVRRMNLVSGTVLRSFGEIGGASFFRFNNTSGLIDNRNQFNCTTANVEVLQTGVGAQFNNAGVINIAPGRQFMLSGRTFDHSGGQVLGGGEFELSSVTAVGNGTFNAVTDVVVNATIFETPFVNSSNVTVRSFADFMEPLTNATGATMRISGSQSGNAELDIFDSFDNFGLVRMLNEDAGFDRESNVRIRSTMFNHAGATLATWRGARSSLRRIIMDIGAELHNAGDFRVSTQATIVNSNGLINNTGRIICSNADLVIDQNLASQLILDGIVRVHTSQTLLVDDGVTVITGATISGGGTLEMHNVDVPGDGVHNNQLHWLLRDCDVHTRLMNLDRMSIRGDTEFNRVVTNASLGNIAVEGTQVDGSAIFRINQGFLNNGRVTLDVLDDSFFQDARIFLDADVSVTSATGAVIEVLNTTSGSRILDQQFSSRFVSYGDITISTGAVFTLGGGRVTIATDATLSGFGTLDPSAVGDLFFYGIVNPGASPGRLDAIGSFEFQPEAEYRVEIGGTTASLEYDQFSMPSGVMVFDGVLDINLIDGFTPQEGDQFVIAEYEDHVGAFSEVRNNDLGGGLQLLPDYRSDRLVLFVSDETLIDVDVYLQGLWNGTTHKRSAAIVELREGVDLFTSVLTTRTSALISSEATIRAAFDNIVTGDYWIIVRHGGHFSVASESRITITQGQQNSVDFTDADNVVNGVTGMTTVTLNLTDYDVVRTGDLNSDLSVSADDFIQLFLPNFGVVNPGQVPLLD